ncbi:MAG TPA: TIM-barrel domain-containing protein, partial [Sunxiuqinia sp.]|nr:TIM-barrel domain-containing protein [Sunxiuqinia sp.]
MNLKTFRFLQGPQIVFWALVLILGISGCKSSDKSVAVLNSGDNSFAALQIVNPYGNAFTISAGANAGAIGYVVNADTFWVKGSPEVSKLSETVSSYTWNNKGREVMLTISQKEHEKVLTLKLNSDAVKPSKWLLNTTAAPDEYFTGVFERVVDGTQYESWKEGITAGMNLRGQKVDVKLKPTLSAYAPFYISSQNYGFFVHGTWPGVIDFCNEKPNLVQIAFEGSELTFSLYTDEGPAGIVKRHTMEAGPAFLPPKWAFGPWRWRDEHLNKKTYFDGSKVHAPYNSQIVEDVLMMQAYDIPFTAYWIDRPWSPGTFGYDDFKIDKDRLPNFQNMIHWLNGKNAELMLWIGPFVMGNMADYAEQHHYELVSKSRVPAKQVLMDFTNEEACKWWGENGPAKLAKMGVKGFKLDRADGEKLCDSLNLKTSIGTTYRENYNDFPVQYVKATYDAVHPILGDDMMLFPRAQYTGSQKYGGLWAGDTGN